MSGKRADDLQVANKFVRTKKAGSLPGAGRPPSADIFVPRHGTLFMFREDQLLQKERYVD